MDKLHVRWAREVKHLKIKQLTMDAQKAFQQHDSFKLYHAISRSCPKQRAKRTHLKGDDGNFLTPTKETAAYVKFIADTLSCHHLEFLSLLLSLNRSLQPSPRRRPLHQALDRDPSLNLCSLQNGSLRSFRIGGALILHISPKHGKMLGLVGFPNLTSHPQGWRIFECWACKNRWGKQC